MFTYGLNGDDHYENGHRLSVDETTALFGDRHVGDNLIDIERLAREHQIQQQQVRAFKAFVQRCELITAGIMILAFLLVMGYLWSKGVRIV